MNRNKFDSLIRELDEKNNPLYLEVYKYHADVNQLYGDLPYSFHLNMVKNIVNQYSYDYLEAVRFTNEDTIKSELNTLQISAIEHDLIEDTRLNYTQVYKLNNRFLNDPIESSRITEIVYALTDEKGRNRYERHNEKYWETLNATKFAPYIKLCDRYANMIYSKYINFNKSMLAQYVKEIHDFELNFNLEDNVINTLIQKLRNL